MARNEEKQQNEWLAVIKSNSLVAEHSLPKEGKKHESRIWLKASIKGAVRK